MPIPDPRPESLLFEYAERIDAGDFDAVGRLFADAVITDPSGAVVARGEQAAAELFAATTRRFADGTPKTKHLTTNSIVELSDDGRRASVRSYFVVLQKVDGSPLQPIVAGRYHDQLELIGGRWRFRERCMLPEMFGDVSNHLLFDPSHLVDPGDSA
jgi:ketosteroid isomerase-like protein